MAFLLFKNQSEINIFYFYSGKRESFLPACANIAAMKNEANNPKGVVIHSLKTIPKINNSQAVPYKIAKPVIAHWLIFLLPKQSDTYSVQHLALSMFDDGWARCIFCRLFSFKDTRLIFIFNAINPKCHFVLNKDLFMNIAPK